MGKEERTFSPREQRHVAKFLKAVEEAFDFSLMTYITRQKTWSRLTFGEGERQEGLLKHIEKELQELREADKEHVLFEWIDIIILALDGAWRSGHSAAQIVNALEEKQKINFAREWPDPETLGTG